VLGQAAPHWLEERRHRHNPLQSKHGNCSH
jgi:hypothetical protein